MKVVINRDYGGFGVSKELLYRSIQENNSLVQTATSSNENWETNWKPLIEKYLDQEYKGYMACDEGPHLYDEKNQILYSIKDDIKLRTNPDLIRLVEEMGDEANGNYAKLEIVEVSDGAEWYIKDYDGMEEVHETHSI